MFYWFCSLGNTDIQTACDWVLALGRIQSYDITGFRDWFGYWDPSNAKTHPRAYSTYSNSSTREASNKT